MPVRRVHESGHENLIQPVALSALLCKEKEVVTNVRACEHHKTGDRERRQGCRQRWQGRQGVGVVEPHLPFLLRAYSARTTVYPPSPPHTHTRFQKRTTVCQILAIRCWSWLQPVFQRYTLIEEYEATGFLKDDSLHNSKQCMRQMHVIQGITVRMVE